MDARIKREHSDDFSDRLAKLSPAKRALLELRLNESGREPMGRQIIPRRQANESVPLSFAQQRLWFLNQLEPASPVYNEPSAVLLIGPLDNDALEQALNKVVERHEVLRTTIGLVNGLPQQLIADSRSVELPVIDLRTMTGTDRDAEVQRLIITAIRRPFDLSHDLMLRTLLIRLAEDEHLCLIIKHHISSDGWSTALFWQELGVLYRAFTSGQPSPLAELPVQYADYAIWQRDWLQGEVLEMQVSYWKKQLTNLSTLHLPTDRPRPRIPSYRGARKSIVIPLDLSDALKELSRKRGATLFMTLLAAFQTLLHRYTGQNDIAVGSPIAGRTRQEIEGLIGFFVNTLILRTDFTGDQTFNELLKQVRETALAAYGHQDVPFEKLVEELQPERDLGRLPLFQVAFALQNVPRHRLELPGIDVRSVDVDGGTAKFDLFVAIRDDNRALRININYSTDLFDDVTITRMLGHFQTLLRGIAADSDQRISELTLLTNPERRQLLVDWNNNRSDYPRDECIHQLFQEQAERTPDAVAVVFKEQRLTYGELNKRANKLAHHLMQLGVRPESQVGICLERTPEMVVGLLGILKAGGAYVPLDPSYPKDRLAFMLEDTQAKLLLTQEGLLEKFPSHNVRVVLVDKDWEIISQQRAANPINEAVTENLAYVIYTSGSTGNPKGTEVLHRGVLRLLQGVNYAQFDENQTFLHLAPLTFDASTFEIWGALLHGAKCILFPGEVPNPIEIDAEIRRNQVNTLWLTASLFNVVVDDSPELLSGVRQLLIGGETLSVAHVRRALTLLPETEIINGYGPTENTTFTCCYPIPRLLHETTTSIPIGRPISNTQVYLLDCKLNPVPIGVAGELYIGGDGLARGYFHQPELTAEKFIPHPFGDLPGLRLYKTGDLARYLPDGPIEFLGRIDNQVKIRGYRIEPGEIEEVLSRHPDVKDAVVIPRSDTSDEKILTAYIVLRRNHAVTTEELKEYLKSKLPQFMIPGALVFLDSLPLTPNGKIDRQALPQPDQKRIQAKVGYPAPRSATESSLAELWVKLLRIERIGVHDNFFDLGGHSLLAARLIAEMERQFKKRLPLSALFEEATIEHLARLLDQEQAPDSPSCLVAIQPKGSKRPFFCVHEFFGDVLCYRNLARHLGQDQPFYALEAKGLKEGEDPMDNLEIMAADYIEQIRTVQPHGPYALGGLCLGGVVAFEIAQQLRAEGESVALVALLDSSIRSEHSQFSWGRFIANLFRDLPSWLMGSLQLTRGQWSDLIRMKLTVSHPRGGLALGSSKQTPSDEADGRFVAALADVFGFSENHRKVARAQYKAQRQYRPRVYPGKITLFRARMQPFFSSHEREKGWGPLAEGGLEVVDVPSNHLGMLQEPHVRVLARQISQRLNGAIKS